MNIEELREYCISIKGASEGFPFDERTLVFKVMEKMFALINIEPKDGIFKVSLKCDPIRSADLRECYEGVTNGLYTKDIKWNCVALEQDVEDSLIKELIDHSVDEVIKNLSKKKQQEYYK